MEEVNKTAEIPNAGNDGANVDVNTENTVAVGSEEVSKKKSNLRGRWKRPNNATTKNQDNKQASSDMTEISVNKEEVVEESTAKQTPNKPHNQNLRNKQNDAGRQRFKDSNQKSYRFSDERRHTNANKQPVAAKDDKPKSCCLLGAVKNLFCKLFGKKSKNQTCSITELDDSRPKKKYYKNRSYSKRPNNKSYKNTNNS